MDWDKFPKLYDHNRIKKDIHNVNTITYKLGPALIRTTNYRLEIAK